MAYGTSTRGASGSIPSVTGRPGSPEDLRSLVLQMNAGNKQKSEDDQIRKLQLEMQNAVYQYGDSAGMPDLEAQKPIYDRLRALGAEGSYNPYQQQTELIRDARIAGQSGDSQRAVGLYSQLGQRMPDQYRTTTITGSFQNRRDDMRARSVQPVQPVQSAGSAQRAPATSARNTRGAVQGTVQKGGSGYLNKAPSTLLAASQPRGRR